MSGEPLQLQFCFPLSAKGILKEIHTCQIDKKFYYGKDKYKITILVFQTDSPFHYREGNRM